MDVEPPSYPEPPSYIEPPSYDEIVNKVELLHPPATFQIRGRVIYSDKYPTEPLFELSLDPRYLRDTTRSLAIERLDTFPRPPRSPNSSPYTATLKRHIYDLKHPGIITGPVFLYNAEAVSRQSLCSLGMSTFRPRRLSLTSGFRVHRATKRFDNPAIPRSLLFSAVSSKTKGVKYEWSNGQEEIVARELDSKKLFITKDMNTKKRDALVASWVLRIWWETADTVNYEL